MPNLCRCRMREWDGDGDGCIDFAEFLDAMTRILTDTDNEGRLKEAFRMFDKVRNRRLSLFFLKKIVIPSFVKPT